MLALGYANHAGQRLAHAGQHPAGQAGHQLSQGARGGIGQQRRAELGVAGRGLHQGQPAARRQGRIGPVFNQQHPGPLRRGLGQQLGLGLVPLEIEGNGGGIGDHLRAIH